MLPSVRLKLGIWIIGTHQKRCLLNRNYLHSKLSTELEDLDLSYLLFIPSIPIQRNTPKIRVPEKYAPLKPKVQTISPKNEFRKERHTFKFKKEVR